LNHLEQYIIQEINCLKSARHPSILLCLGATMHDNEIYLVQTKPPKDAISLTDFLMKHDSSGPAIFKQVYEVAK